MRKILTTCLVTGLLASYANAQTPQRVIPASNDDLYPEFIEFSASNAPAYVNGKVQQTSVDGRMADSAVDVKQIRSERDVLGFIHHRTQQLFGGIPVENAEYIVHEKNGLVLAQNGKMVRNFPANLSIAPSITEKEALAYALKFIGASTYKWELPGEELVLKRENNDQTATYLPTGKLVLYSGSNVDVVPSSLRLAFKFDIYAQLPLSRQFVYVDAATGKILGNLHRIHHTNATGSAVTAYSGTQTITTDNTGSTYRLRETGRGGGIQTLNMKNAGTSYAAAVDFTDADNNWNNVNADKDEYATDAHWGAEKSWDYYNSKYGRNSVDNAGKALLNYVHANLVAFGYGNNVNAFWDGNRMTYGDGNTTYSPLTSLDIIGHEITHGVTQFSSNLNYAGESGAMNEGFSDIFGTAIEFYARPSRANWDIGEDIGAAFRNMSNPNTFSDPDTYGGTYWVTTAGCSPTGSNDNCGVHTNSGVLNFWFYLLTVGGSGTNDLGTAYNVTGIGVDKAGAIAYRLNTVYLVSTSNFASARTNGIKAAEDLYGVGSAEATQTANAWTAVGVGASTPPTTCTDNYEANETRATAKAIATNTAITAKISSSTDKDYFSFTTTAAAPKVQVTLTNVPADYDVRLYNSAGTQLAISQNGSTTSETIKYNSATAAATYYIQVYGYNGVNSTSCYTLTASTSGTNFINGVFNNSITDGSMKQLYKPFAIGPNPVVSNGDFTVWYQAIQSGTQQITITDLTGRTVHNQRVSVIEGPNAISVKLPVLAKGTYIVRMDAKNFSKISVQ